MKLIKEFCLICMFLCAGYFHDLRASESNSYNFEQPDSLMAAGNYFEAAIAYERIFFFSTDQETRIRANLKRADALTRQGEFARALNDLQRSAHLRNFPDLHFEVLFQMAFCNYMAGNYGQALSRLKQLNHFYAERAESPNVLLLFTLTAIMAEELEMAGEFARQMVLSANLAKQDEANLLHEVSVLFAEENFPRLRSETRASNLSTFIPGAGHVYAGYAGKGIVNATSQILSLGLAVLMGYHGLYASGFVVGLGMFQSFYFGGIRQAAFLTHQRNLIEMGNYKELRKDFVLDIFEMQESDM